MNSGSRGLWLRILRWSGTVLLVAWLFSLIDVRETIRILSTTRLDLLLAVLGTILVIRIFMAWRWLYVLRVLGVQASFMDVLRITMVSITLNLVMPGGGATVDAYRTWSMSRLRGDMSAVTASVVADRLFGLYSLTFVAFLAVQFAGALPGRMDWDAVLGWIFLASTIAVSLLVIAGSALLGRTSGLFARWPRASRGVARTAQLLKDVAVLRKVAVPSTLLAVPVQVLRGVEFYLIYKAIGVDIGLSVMLVYAPIVFVLMILPVSVGGLGLREGAFYFMLSPHGVSADSVVAAAVLFHALGVIMGLPGALWISKGATARSLKTLPVEQSARGDPP